jgi:hypothetical protein
VGRRCFALIGYAENIAATLLSSLGTWKARIVAWHFRRSRLAGTWAGTYEFYGHGGFEPLAPSNFTLWLRDGFFGRFRGFVRDDPFTGMPDTGKIDGVLRADQVSFTKRMPRMFFGSAEGQPPKPMSELVLPDGSKPFDDVPHPLLHYRGVLSVSGTSATGTWTLEAIRCVSRDGRATIELPSSTGTWSIRRIGDARSPEND